MEESDSYDVVIYGANCAGVIAAYTAKTMGKSVILIEPGNHLGEMTTTGLRMDRFYSASPTCFPTRGSIITGRHPNRYGTFTPGFSIRPEEISIAQIMKDAGYATAHFDKRHLGPVKAKSPTNPKAMGFDEYLSHDNFFELNPHLSRNGSGEQPYKRESSEILIAEAIRFIQRSMDTLNLSISGGFFMPLKCPKDRFLCKSCANEKGTSRDNLVSA